MTHLNYSFEKARKLPSLVGDEPVHDSSFKIMHINYDESFEKYYTKNYLNQLRLQEGLPQKLEDFLQDCLKLVKKNKGDLFCLDKKAKFDNALLQSLIFVGIMTIICALFIAIRTSNDSTTQDSIINNSCYALSMVGFLPLLFSFQIWRSVIPLNKDKEQKLGHELEHKISKLIEKYNKNVFSSKNWYLSKKNWKELSLIQTHFFSNDSTISLRSATLPELRGTGRNPYGISRDPGLVRMRLISFTAIENGMNKAF